MKTFFAIMLAVASTSALADNAPYPWYRPKNFDTSKLGVSASRNWAIGLQAIKAENWPTCITAFESIAKEGGYGVASALVNQGYCQSRTNRFSDAIRSLEKAISIDPQLKAPMASSLSMSYYKLAYAQIDEGNIPKAKANLDKSLTIDPKNSEALSDLAFIYSQTGQPKLCVAKAKEAIQANSENSPAYSNLGLCLFSLNQFPEALAAFDQSIKRNPKLAQTYLNRAATKVELKRCDDARSDFKTATQLEPQYSNMGSSILGACAN